MLLVADPEQRRLDLAQPLDVAAQAVGVAVQEGLGETELGRANGFMLGDEKMLALERAKMGRPGDMQVDMHWPDGIRRDQERTRESMEFIKQHPVWYLGVMLGRMWGMLKVAGDPPSTASMYCRASFHLPTWGASARRSRSPK